MNTQQATTLIGTSAGSALLVAGLLIGSFLPRPAEVGAAAPASAMETAAATPKEAPARSDRRSAHAALSMPYFSFAQLLRTGS